MKQLFDVNSAARLWSISPWTVRSYIHNGKLKPVRLGRRVLLEEAEMERFIAQAKTLVQNQLNREEPLVARDAARKAVDGEGVEHD
jgi:excisionase family DNA binding protein